MQNRALKTGEFIALCAFLISLTGLSIDGVLPAFRQISDELALSNPADTRYLISLFFLGLVIGELFIGAVSDAVGRKKSLIGGLIIFCVGTVIAISAQSL